MKTAYWNIVALSYTQEFTTPDYHLFRFTLSPNSKKLNDDSINGLDERRNNNIIYKSTHILLEKLSKCIGSNGQYFD